MLPKPNLPNLNTSLIAIESCSSSSTSSSKNQIKQFHTINSIYQLHSIINQLSIQKQKYFIAYTTVLNNMQQNKQKYQADLAQVKKIRQGLEKQINVYKGKLEFQKQGCKKVCKQKEELSKLLDTVIDKDKNITVYTVISDYLNIKNQLKQKSQQITSLSQQLNNKQSLLLQTSNQITSLNNHLFNEITKLTNRLNQQQQHNRIQKQMLMQQYDIQRQKLSKQLKEVKGNLDEQRTINVELYNKIRGYQGKVKEFLYVGVDKQLNQMGSRNISSNCKNNENLPYKQRYQNLKQHIQQLTEQNYTLKSQNTLLSKQLQHSQSKFTSLQKQLLQKDKKIQLVQQSHFKMSKTILQINDLHKKTIKQPNQYIIKLQQNNRQSKTQIHKLQKQLSQHKITISNLQNKIKQNTIQTSTLKNRVKTQQSHLENLLQIKQQLLQTNSFLQSTNYKLQSQNKTLLIKIQYFIQNINKIQNQLKCKQQIIRRIQKQQKFIKLTPQKYEKILSNILTLQKDKQQSNKQNIKIRKQLLQLQKQTINKIKNYNQLQNKLQQTYNKISILQAELQHIKTKLQKSNKTNEIIIKQSDQQKQKLINKIKQLKQVVQKIQENNRQYQYVNKLVNGVYWNNNKNNRMNLQNKKVIDLTIIPNRNRYINKNQSKSLQKYTNIDHNNNNNNSTQNSFLNTIKIKTQATKKLNQALTRDSSKQHHNNTNNQNTQHNVIYKKLQDNNPKNNGTANFYSIRSQKQKIIKQQQNINKTSQNIRNNRYKIVRQISKQRQNKYEQQDQRIDNIIRELKSQNRQLSKSKLYDL